MVTVLPTGFRHDVVLRERPGKPLEIRIGVETGDLAVSRGKGGRLLLKGKDKKLVASAARPVMWDGRANGRLPLAKRLEIGTDVVTKNGRTELVLKPDQAFLTDAGTTYPVRVAAAVTLPLGADIDVSSDDLPALPDNPYMMAGTMTGGTKARVHLRFDTAGLQGSTVTNATLSMNTIDSHNCGAALANGIQVARLTGAWDPDNLYWANKPAHTTEDASTNFKGVNFNCDTYPDSMDWNVTGIAQDWAAGAVNHGLVLKSPGETNINNYRVFTSSEDTDFTLPPTLTITTSGPASQPAVSDLAITPAQTVDGTTVTPSLTPQLAATIADPASGNLTGEFEIEHDPTATEQGTGQIWADASPAVASGGRATVSVPVGKLADGWKIRWRARAVNATASTASAWSGWQELTVDAADPVSDPSVDALQVDPSKQVSGTTVTSSLTPALLAQVNNPIGGTLRAEFEVEHDPAATGQGTGRIWAGAVDDVASGTQAIVQIPAGTLTDGWKIRWRARAVAGQTSSPWAEWREATVDVVQAGEEPLATTAGPIIRTDQSFTVAAWLRWSDKEGAYSVAEQLGTHQPAFVLGNTPDRGLVFTRASADTADAGSAGVFSDVEPPVNEWFHVAGVFDATANTMSLYLNGALLRSETVSGDPWNAAGAMTLGTRMMGSVDEILIHQSALTAADIGALVSVPVMALGAERPEPAPTAKADEFTAQALPSFDYDRVNSIADCTRLRETSDFRYSTPGWRDLRPYSGCWSKILAYGDWTYHPTEPGKYPPKPDDGYKVEATVVMHSYLGTADGNGVVGGGDRLPNQVKIWTQLEDIVGYDDGEPTDDFDDKQLQLEVQVKGSDGAACEVTEGETRRAAIHDWKRDGYDEWLVESSVGEGDAHNCTIRPLLFEFGGVNWFNEARPLWGKIEFENILGDIKLPFGIQAIGLPTGSRSEFAPVVRCDDIVFSKNFGDRQHTGACIFADANRIFTMKRGDAAIDEVVQHIDKALTSPGETIPALPPTDAQGRPQSKIMPGNIDADSHITVGGQQYNNPAHLWLVRNTDPPDTEKTDTLTYKNRKAIGPACRAERTRLKTEGQWPANVIVNGKSVPKLQCDEYPFASTKNGAHNSKGHFSIRYVDRVKNRLHGQYLAAFYSRYRVGNDNRFWVRISN
ncbi:DNRLRE domain-containing protein [Nonomuraea glycinis]|uniref:LamG-like jellyroll fold domain-containing protein n=1 Tax=Nonomuraea glycinis TaxID=2047744 RepID=A0A918A2A4_9ACTN|nr:DNRLRE domain-containing protein [Nonomuraea glycinis]MCA2175458.1 DNRLRE domain-containing protein [Nonomuraea glycinis]GGP04752.1 hypothetical protein GCM10012278_21230 [Nonomuraea glycinis]